MFRATLGSVAITVASADAATCMASAFSLPSSCPIDKLTSLQSNPDLAVLREVKGEVCEAGACKTAVDKANADCADQPEVAKQFGQLTQLCDGNDCMEKVLTASADFLTCGVTVPAGEDQSKMSAERLNKLCDPSCKAKIDKTVECMKTMDQLDDASAFDTLNGMCMPCVKEFMSVPEGATCGGQKLPTKENVQNAECKEAYCAMKSACPLPSTVTQSPFAGINIGMDDYKAGMQTVIDNAGCPAPTSAPAEQDADSAYASGVGLAALVAAAAIIV